MLLKIYTRLMGFPGSSDGKTSAYNVGDLGSIPGIDPGKILWRRKWQPTPVFLPGKFHGLRSLVGYSPWGHKERFSSSKDHSTTASVLLNPWMPNHGYRGQI